MTSTPGAGPHLDAVIAALAGPAAQARPDQLAAVTALVDHGRRVLVVQATGWGKSAVYWAATAAIRARGGGPSLVVSPLLALMRDQIAAAGRAGLRAATVNSTNFEDWDEVLGRLDNDELDVLLVSPERLANPRFGSRLGRLMARCGLLVIDEAHCISDWGFDFRPDYQRLSTALLGLAPGTPILATTATANDRVTVDVARQLGSATLILRGTLARASLRLAVTAQLGPLDRYAWVADALVDLPGSGIVYALTVAETVRLTAFLRSEGFDVLAYNGQLDTAERQMVENRLRANQVKAVVATSALGMGYDKPDLAFVIHLGSPASPVGYYQQIGRAGRALEDALAVLLPSAGDEAIWEYFASASIPDPAAAEAVLAHLAAKGPCTTMALEAATGLRRTRLESLVKILAVDGAVAAEPGGWVRTDKPWHFDSAKYGALLAVRANEADLMRRYATGSGCLMAFLQQALDDPGSGLCGRCSVCTGILPPPGERPSAARAAAVRTFLRGQDVVLQPRKLWPSGMKARKGKIGIAIAPGRALAYADDPAWSDALAGVDRFDGPLSGELADGIVALLQRWRDAWPAAPVAVVAVPSRRRAQRVQSLAELVADELAVPVLAVLTQGGPPAPAGVASIARAEALVAGLSVVAPLPRPGPVLLVDDLYRTGWTMTVAGVLLAQAGATAVWPLALQQLP